MIGPEKQWYILYTHPRMEKKLAKILELRQIEYYLPLLRLKKKWSDRFKLVVSPVFPSYIFIKMIFSETKNKVITLPGAHHFLTINHEPQTVAEDDLNMVKLFIEKYPESVKTQKEAILVPGKKIEIKHGYFKGYKGTITKIKNKARLCVQLPVGNVSVEVNIDDLGLEELNV